MPACPCAVEGGGLCAADVEKYRNYHRLHHACWLCHNGQRRARVAGQAQALTRCPRASRTEPIFYNGKTYTLKFAPASAGGYDVAVLGMTPKQKADATNIATSAIRYFTCPDGKTGKLTSAPRYEADTWKMSARCGETDFWISAIDHGALKLSSILCGSELQIYKLGVLLVLVENFRL